MNKAEQYFERLLHLAPEQLAATLRRDARQLASKKWELRQLIAPSIKSIFQLRPPQGDDLQLELTALATLVYKSAGFSALPFDSAKKTSALLKVTTELGIAENDLIALQPCARSIEEVVGRCGIVIDETL